MMQVYRRSKLQKFVNAGKLDRDVHILGNSAYPLEENLMVPYRDNRHLNEIQKKFNYIHSASRCSVERDFRLLKCKFRRLRYLDICNLDNAPVIIITSCTLHNYILQNETDVHDVDIEPDEDVLGIEHDASSTANKAAVQKHDAIAFQLHK